MENLILKKLEEYGESVVQGKSKKKNKKDRKTEDSQIKKTEPNTTPMLVTVPKTYVSERQKKKRRKKKKKESKGEKMNENAINENEPQLSGHERRLREMSEQLGLGEFKTEIERKQSKKQEDTTKPEVVVFTSHKSKKSKKAEHTEVTESTQSPDFDMKQARFDVQKFGIKGFQGNLKDEAMAALLIKLGAKPPKNKYVNYKDYQESVKQKKIEEKEKRERDRKLGYKVPKANRGNKRPRDRNDIGPLDGQVGRWKSGVQIVKPDDLKGLKKAKLK